MAAIMELMLAIRENTVIFYHRDTKQFDYDPRSSIERTKRLPGNRLPLNDTNNIRLPSYREIDHNEIMRFYVREYVEDKAQRKELFGILSRKDYMDAYLDRLQELNLYEDFVDACGDVYIQIFEEWAEKHDLDFTSTEN